MADPKRKILLLNYRAGTSMSGIGEDDSAMTLGPHILKSHLLRNGRRDIEISVTTLDQRECQETTLRNIHALKPHIVGFSCFVWNYFSSLSLARKLKLILPDTKVIFGGAEVSDKDFSVEMMNRNPWIDAVFRGEAETSLEMYLDGNVRRDKIEGLIYKENDRIAANDCLPRFAHPEETPSVYTPAFVRQFPVVYYATSRGCVGRCRYCQEWSKKRNLPLDRVEKDLGVIFKHGKMKMFHFIDSVLDDDPERLNHILEITARLNKQAVPIGGYFYFRNADPELFEKLRRAHFKSLRIGVETHNKEALRRTGRGEGNLSCIDSALPYKGDFNIVPYIITHLPEETPESFRTNIKECFHKGLFKLDFHCNRL
ncbi:MAG TPA: radical SAM protein, partial [bacterium]|nr:radical SAM protein [bacterium]